MTAEGWPSNAKRVSRLDQEEGLSIRIKATRRRVSRARDRYRRRRCPRRSLDSQIEAGGPVRPSGPAAGAVHVAPLSQRERARHPRP